MNEKDKTVAKDGNPPDEGSVSCDSSCGSDGEESRELQKKSFEANRKRKASGGFQSMGLSYPTYNAISKKGYKVPTPVQRRSIPIIMQGRDVVTMARTGSGKTAAFVIPMVEKLKSHSAKVGARAVILSPNRELALQTLKVVKELGRYTDLRSVLLVGGDRLEDQFADLSTNPDIIIATPGRLLHILMEMSLELKTLSYLVFDEADRLFEMGFSDAINEIMHRVSSERQTLLFSATLPKTLVEFSKAGLTDPVLIRLDADSKISPDLDLAFFTVKATDKEAALIYLLRTVIKQGDKTIIFASTKHHVEYLHELLLAVGIDNCYIYGSLNQTARTINLAKFSADKVNVLIVTDVASRGIDIPLLNNVIHYDFTDRSKLFIHRSGRAARAGRPGVSFAFITNEDLPYLLDLQLFLARPLNLSGEFAQVSNVDLRQKIVLGDMPYSLIQDDIEKMTMIMQSKTTVSALHKVAENGAKLYTRSRHPPSKESSQRAKKLLEMAPVGSSRLGIHPLLRKFMGDNEQEKLSFLDKLRDFRPTETIFEFAKSKANQAEIAMKARRNQSDVAIRRAKETKKDAHHDFSVTNCDDKTTRALAANEQDISDCFGMVVGKKRTCDGELINPFRDNEFYIPHCQNETDRAADKEYAVHTDADLKANFLSQASRAELDVSGDDPTGRKKVLGKLTWDSKKKRYIRPTIGADNKKLIRTEHNTYLPASYKTNA